MKQEVGIENSKKYVVKLGRERLNTYQAILSKYFY